MVFASDELFADARNLVSATPAAHDPGAYGPRGKVYDGWETRRRREAGSDFVVVRLAAPAIVRAVNIDTSFFTGNFPPHASVEAATIMGYPSPAEVLAAEWTPLLGRTQLHPDTGNVHPVPRRPARHPCPAHHLPRRRGCPAARLRRGDTRPAAPRRPR